MRQSHQYCFEKVGYLERQPAPASFSSFRKSYRGNPPIKMTTTATAQTTAASRLRSALSSTAPPFFPELAESDGSKGGGWAVTNSVAPGVGVGCSIKESGLPVDAVPVGIAVIEMSLISNPNATHASWKSKPKPSRRQWDREGRKRERALPKV